MRTIIKGLLQINWQPQLQFVRHRTKVNITRPRPPHFERALLENVCYPYFPRKKQPQHIPNPESCGQVKVTNTLTDHPLRNILANESLNWFKNSKLIAFFHFNAASADEKFRVMLNLKCQLLLKKNGMKLLFFENSVIQKALTNTVFESLLGLYNAPTATVFSQESDLHKLLNIIKKLPKLVFMGAAFENRLLSLTDLEKYGKFGSLDEARLVLVSTLMAAPQCVTQQLNHHPTTVVGMLNQYKKILEK